MKSHGRRMIEQDLLLWRLEDQTSLSVGLVWKSIIPMLIPSAPGK